MTDLFSALLWANNVTSGVMVIVCWWLAHQFARLQPPGRLAAVMFGLLGINTLYIALARNFEVDVSWPSVLSKAILSVCLILLVIRRYTKAQA